MVIPDIFDNPKVSKKPSSSFAPPMDRFLAGVFDVILHYPLIYLFVIGLKRKLNLIELYGVTTEESIHLWMQLFVIVSIVSVFLLAISFRLFQASIGMRLMKLEVRSFHGGRLSWGQSFTRAGLWWMSSLLLGLPFLEIVSHPQRRALHDRGSDTFVITKKKINVLPPLPIEGTLVRSLLVASAFAVLAWLGAFLEMGRNNIVSGKYVIDELTDRGLLCEDVTENFIQGTPTGLPLEDRLAFAASLYISGDLNEDCLETEIHLSSIKNTAAIYRSLSLALISPRNTELQKVAKDQVCEQSVALCKTLKSFLGEDRDVWNISEIEKQWGGAALPYQVLATQMLVQVGDVENASKYFELLTDLGFHSKRLKEKMLFLALEANPESHALGIAAAVENLLPKERQFALSRDLCLRVLEKDCDYKSQSCQSFIRIMSQKPAEIGHDPVSRALAKYLNCSHQNFELADFVILMENKDQIEISDLSLAIFKGSNPGAAMARLRNIVKNDSLILETRFDALQVLLNSKASPEDMDLFSYIDAKMSPQDSFYFTAWDWYLKKIQSYGRPDLLVKYEGKLKKISGLAAALDEIQNDDRKPASIGPGR